MKQWSHRLATRNWKTKSSGNKAVKESRGIIFRYVQGLGLDEKNDQLRPYAVTFALPGLSISMLRIFSEPRRNFWNLRVGSALKDRNWTFIDMPNPLGLIATKRIIKHKKGVFFILLHFFLQDYTILLNSQPRIMHFAYSDWFTQSWLSGHIPWFDLIW